MDEQNKYPIPPLPTVTIQVMQYDYSSADASVRDMEKIIQPDRGISTEILRIANSAYYGRSGKIKNVRDAVALLGLKALKNLVIFLSMKSISDRFRGDVYKRYLKELPILTALVARDLSEKVGHRNLSDEAFLAGLLSRVGMTILAMKRTDHYSVLMSESDKNGFDLRDLEQTAYGTNHSILSREAAIAWNLPEDLIQSIAFDMDSQDPAAVEDPLQKITIISALLGEYIAGTGGKKLASEKAAQLMQHFKFPVKIDSFLNDEYIKGLKEHPYYQMVVA